MREYDTVTEVRAAADLRVAVPLAMGSNVGKAVEDLLLVIDEIRYVADVETRNVEKTSERLMADVTARLTVHLPGSVDDDTTATIQTILANHEPVETVETVAVSDAYPIESY